MITKKEYIKRLFHLWGLAITPFLVSLVVIIFLLKGLHLSDFFVGILVVFGLMYLRVAIGMTWERLGKKIGVFRGKDWSEIKDNANKQ